jgi:hypothetical protein
VIADLKNSVCHFRSLDMEQQLHLAQADIATDKSEPFRTDSLGAHLIQSDIICLHGTIDQVPRSEHSEFSEQG